MLEGREAVELDMGAGGGGWWRHWSITCRREEGPKVVLHRSTSWLVGAFDFGFESIKSLTPKSDDN